MIQQRRPGHSTRLEIIKQRLALTFSQRVAAASDQDLSFLKKFSRRATNSCFSSRVVAVFYARLCIGCVKLAAGKSMIATKKGELLAALDQKNFWVIGIGLVAKKELLKVPVLGVGMGFVNVMAIDRSNRESAIRTTEAAAQRIKSGVSFAVFVEGTRAKPGELLPFKKGAFYMARQAGVPVVPVAIKNSDVLMGKGTGEARAGTLEMVLLPPVETAGVESDEDMNQLIASVRASIAAELSPQKST